MPAMRGKEVFIVAEIGDWSLVELGVMTIGSGISWTGDSWLLIVVWSAPESKQRKSLGRFQLYHVLPSLQNPICSSRVRSNARSRSRSRREARLPLGTCIEASQEPDHAKIPTWSLPGPWVQLLHYFHQCWERRYLHVARQDPVTRRISQAPHQIKTAPRKGFRLIKVVVYIKHFLHNHSNEASRG